jgi:hypothetical protein
MLPGLTGVSNLQGIGLAIGCGLPLQTPNVLKLAVFSPVPGEE